MASISKRGNYWQYRISYQDHDKKWKTKNKGGFDTKKEAQVAARNEEIKFSQGYDISYSDKTFPEYFEEWYKVFRKGKYSKGNDRDIRAALSFAQKNFANVKMKDLDSMIYQKAMNEYGETRATSTVQKIHIYLRASLRDAIQEGIIFRDPTYRAKIVGKVQPKLDESKYMNYNDTLDFVKEIRANLDPLHPARYMILFALATGCRYAEIAGLTWDCVDFEGKTIRINKTWDYVYKTGFAKTKNYQSQRVIGIDDETIQLLNQLQAAQNYVMSVRKIKNELNLVFVNGDFEIGSNSYANRVVKETCQKLGFSHFITFHSLRHTHGSILLYKGLNLKYVSLRLGHKKVATTIEVYQHVLDEMEQVENQKSAEIVQDFLS